jgi:hypothetical protein
LTVGQEDATRGDDDDDDETGDATFLTGLFTPAKSNDWSRPAAAVEPQSPSPHIHKRPAKKQSTLSMSVGEYFQILSDKRQVRAHGGDSTAVAHYFPSQAQHNLNPKPIEIMCAHQRSVER